MNYLSADHKCLIVVYSVIADQSKLDQSEPLYQLTDTVSLICSGGRSTEVIVPTQRCKNTLLQVKNLHLKSFGL